MDKNYYKHVATAIAAIASLATLLTALFDLECVKDEWYIGAIGIAIVIAFSFIYACWQTRTKKGITLHLTSQQELTIKEGDLFAQNGIICIPVNEYFDTLVGNGVIDENSIHGQFINRYFKDRIPELQNKIQTALTNVAPSGSQTRRVNGCPTKKYELGTCADIRDGANTYVLFALTHFDNNDKAFLHRSEFSEVTRKLMAHLNAISQSQPVFMPLYGTKLSRLRRTAQRILLNLVDTIDFDEKFVVIGGVNVIIKSLAASNVNLTELEDIANRGITDN